MDESEKNDCRLDSLIQICVGGEVEAWPSFLEAAEAVIAPVVRKRVAGAHADDVIHDTLVAIWKNAARVAKVTRVDDYIRAMARNTANSFLRKQSAQTGLRANVKTVAAAQQTGIEPDTEKQVEALDLIDALYRSLPAQDALLIDKCVRRHGNAAEIAKELGKSTRSVEKRLEKLRQVVARFLARQSHEG